MEFFQEAIASHNILVWIILIVLLIVFIKILKSAGKGLFLLIISILAVFALAKIFPGLFDPLIDLVKGG